MKSLIRISAMLLAAFVTCATLPASASEFNITSSTSGSTLTGYTTTFSITRSGEGVDAAETVNFRTVGLSAYAGQHYTATNGVIAFAAGETNKTVAVKERRTVQLDCSTWADSASPTRRAASRSARTCRRAACSTPRA